LTVPGRQPLQAERAADKIEAAMKEMIYVGYSLARRAAEPIPPDIKELLQSSGKES
jgi:hypothetical protein